MVREGRKLDKTPMIGILTLHPNGHSSILAQWAFFNYHLKMKFTQEEIKVLLQGVYNLPVSTNVESLRNGAFKISPLVDNLIIKLQAMNDEEKVETPETTPEPEPETAE